MAARVVYTRPDGGVSVVVPAHEDLLGHVIKNDIPLDAIDVHIMDASEIPSDRTFRNAWRLENKAIAHDIEQCKEIWRDRMRAARAPLLAALDAEFMKALEDEDKGKLASIAMRKKALRDVTDDPMLLKAKSPEEIKAAWPEALR